jgi:two-component system, chemotaxis family, CheB/CheR fusion protein
MNNQDFFVAGIGASAGGYEALKEFFSAIPEKPGITFVLIQHLSPDFKSLTKEWLSKFTKMAIVTVQEDTEVQPDHIYIMPENRILRIKGQNLLLTERDPGAIINLAIDTFFHSLGQELREKAIGIILSGTGTDGSSGVQTIKEHGGAVMVQQPDSAKFDGMPNVAIATDHPDIIQPPKQLAEGLLKYVQNPVNIDEATLANVTASDKELIEEIIEHVSEYSKVNFRGYKINTIIRRIEKRIKLNHLSSISEYHSFTKHNPEEIHILYNSLLIGVTRFFRDTEAFQALENNVVPALFNNRKSFETVRIWVAGCSTGEEAYSVAIFCDEYTRKHKIKTPFKIFATDLDNKSIELAAVGRYRNNIVSDVSPERLESFFEKIGDFYQIKKELRKKIIFARHNLISDPPFIKLDLITCRNLFIYLKPDLQRKLLYNFSFALEPNYFLFLGSNEVSSGVEDLFETVDKKWKILRNKSAVQRRPHVFKKESGVRSEIEPGQSRLMSRRATAHVRKKEGDFEEILNNKYAPACLFVNEDDEVVYTHGEVKKHLQLPQKRMVLDVFEMISGNLSMIFRNGIRKARNGETVMFKNVSTQIDGKPKIVDISFSATGNKDEKAKMVLIDFTEATSAPKKMAVVDQVPKDALSLREIEELEQELKLTKKELLFTVDELETMNEELQASNEEMHSSNEELQSTNEEMQSSNEELHTVNVELQLKLDEISSLHEDINNLINNSEIAIIFLDDTLKIRMFTPAAKVNFNFYDNDIERSFNHLTHNLIYQKFLEDIREVLDNHRSIEKEVEDREGNFYIVRIIPYRTEQGNIKGVVLSFVDITQIKKVTNDLKNRTIELEQSSQNWKSLVNNTPDIIARYDKNLNYISVNNALEKHLGLQYQEIIGKSNRELAVPNSNTQIEKWVACAQEALDTGKPKVDFFYYTNDGTDKYFYSSFVPEFLADGNKANSVLSISRDVTQIMKHEKQIENQNERLRRTNTDLDNFIYTASHDLKGPVVNLEGLIAALKRQLKENTDDTKEKLLDMIDKSCSRLNKTILDLTEITKVQKDIGEPPEEISFKKVFDDVTADNEEMILNTGVVIDEDFQVTHILYSPSNLRSIISNLLTNAIKYRSEKRPLKIAVSTFKEGAYNVLMVKDNGLGMSETQLPKLFKMFSRLHAHVDGTGIGLYIIKRIIENSGGSIEVESKLDEGSCFKVYFPLNYEGNNKVELA